MRSKHAAPHTRGHTEATHLSVCACTCVRSQDEYFGKVIACGKREDASQADAPNVTCEGDNNAGAIAAAAASGLTITGCVEARGYGLCSRPEAKEFCCDTCASGNRRRAEQNDTSCAEDDAAAVAALAPYGYNISGCSDVSAAGSCSAISGTGLCPCSCPPASDTPCAENDTAAVAFLAAYDITISGCSDISAAGSCSDISGTGLCPCSCPPASGSIAEQKDTLELADVDYGSSGAFTINVWFRHDQENFEDYQREQFFGHGNPSGTTAGSPNQLHWQFEKSGSIRTLAVDGTDATSDDCAYCNGGAGGNAGTMAIEAATGEPCGWNRNCYGPYRGFTDTLASEHGAVDNGASWHMLTLTTHPDGSRGYRTYLDGQMRASMPYEGMGVDIFDTDPNGNWERVSNVRLGRPIDPEGPMRFCGRIAGYGGLTQGYWGAQNVNGTLGFHPDRYFMGKVAHASFFSHAMTEEQVNALMASYVKQYNLLPTPPSPPRSPPSPP